MRSPERSVSTPDIARDAASQVVGVLLQLPVAELQQLVAVPKKFQDRFAEALNVVGDAAAALQRLCAWWPHVDRLHKDAQGSKDDA
eukprot:Skav214315  [mRNA]  locus=scaffold998:282551:283004:+ [translate_table: standard]